MNSMNGLSGGNKQPWFDPMEVPINRPVLGDENKKPTYIKCIKNIYKQPWLNSSQSKAAQSPEVETLTGQWKNMKNMKLDQLVNLNC